MSLLLLLTGYLRLHSHQTNWILSAIYLQPRGMMGRVWRGAGGVGWRWGWGRGSSLLPATRSIIPEIHFIVYSHGHKAFCTATCLHLYVASVFDKARGDVSCGTQFYLDCSKHHRDSYNTSHLVYTVWIQY